MTELFWNLVGGGIFIFLILTGWGMAWYLNNKHKKVNS
jgi:hypothetical protein